jgi:hypothetical protein
VIIYGKEIAAEHPHMESRTVWTEVRLLFKRIPTLTTLLITVLALVALVVFAIYFPFQGKTWYETLAIAAWIALLGRRHWASEDRSSETKPKTLSNFPTLQKITDFFRRHWRFIRKALFAILGAAIAVGSMWLLITLIRWFWLHPLFR